MPYLALLAAFVSGALAHAAWCAWCAWRRTALRSLPRGAAALPTLAGVLVLAVLLGAATLPGVPLRALCAVLMLAPVLLHLALDRHGGTPR